VTDSVRIKSLMTVSDDVLSSDVKSKKWDWSHKLVGKVTKEDSNSGY
jgi:hypothetical protein